MISPCVKISDPDSYRDSFFIFPIKNPAFAGLVFKTHLR